MALADGTIIRGKGFGAITKTSGEVVFNTGMVGYPESITDPSYNGQILLQTYPLIGNYGVFRKHFESNGAKIEGYVIRELSREPSHWTSELNLSDWLREEGIPGLEAVDTRMLTKKLRIHGVMLGVLWVFPEENEPSEEEIASELREIADPNKMDLVREVATTQIRHHEIGSRHTIALLDCGVKRNIIQSLTARGLNVIQYPPDTPAYKILGDKPDGILISNGPGDPKMIPYAVETVGALVDSDIPMLGVCLGIQLLALASGADTYKLKFGHRGQNHPVIDLTTGRCFITSQNHGYAVDSDSLRGTDLEVSMVNANDRTVEGFKHRKKAITAVQFHPEASPGPEDTSYLFDEFSRQVLTKPSRR
ncbi:MAG: glutamine-hydrolyzing carbamoyl-phosphate synthase small subunit [Candidatus Bathyarchaeia archaeon]